MLYRVIGVMSGSSLDGLDIVFAEIQEQQGKWSYQLVAAECLPYSLDWQTQLRDAIHLSAKDYLLLHSAYGKYIGDQINKFIDKHELHYQVALIASHGHTSFHLPPYMTAQLGDGAAIAAVTGLPVISDLRSMDVALGGQGAPIVPIGEKLLFKDFDFFLNIGGIANISVNLPDKYVAFDICAANRVMNMLVAQLGKAYDENGSIAATGSVDETVLNQLNALEYYQQSFPKSLSNDFGTEVVYPMLTKGLSIPDALRTYIAHIAYQVAMSVTPHLNAIPKSEYKMMITGGGAFNGFLVDEIRQHLERFQVEIIIPDEGLVAYKEALIMALCGVLRWREENTTLASVTGASRDSVGGAVYSSGKW
jgi:anhydro-N-acetylmuramic acid kinase